MGDMEHVNSRLQSYYKRWNHIELTDFRKRIHLFDPKTCRQTHWYSENIPGTFWSYSSQLEDYNVRIMRQIAEKCGVHYWTDFEGVSRMDKFQGYDTFSLGQQSIFFTYYLNRKGNACDSKDPDVCLYVSAGCNVKVNGAELNRDEILELLTGSGSIHVYSPDGREMNLSMEI